MRLGQNTMAGPPSFPPTRTFIQPTDVLIRFDTDPIILSSSAFRNNFLLPTGVNSFIFSFVLRVLINVEARVACLEREQLSTRGRKCTSERGDAVETSAAPSPFARETVLRPSIYASCNSVRYFGARAMAFLMKEGRHSISPGRTISASRFLSCCNSFCNPISSSRSRDDREYLVLAAP